jgi:hypothetical protein
MKDKKSKVLWGMLAMGLAFALVLVACSKKDSGGSGGDSGGSGGEVSAPKSSGKSGGGGKAAPASDFTYDLSKDDGGKSVVIEKYTGNGGEVVIPAEIEGLPVSTLGLSAFYGESNRDYGPGMNITSVVIPASVKFIDTECFSQIENLTSVTILGTGVDIRSGAFRDCINLSELKFPDGDNVLIAGAYNKDQGDVIGSAGSSAFSGCKKLPLAIRSKLNAMGFTNI